MRMTSLIDYDGEQMYKKYKFTGVPRYIMIDPEGLIIDIAMPGPYNKSMENYIREIIGSYKNKL